MLVNQKIMMTMASGVFALSIIQGPLYSSNNDESYVLTSSPLSRSTSLRGSTGSAALQTQVRENTDSIRKLKSNLAKKTNEITNIDENLQGLEAKHIQPLQQKVTELEGELKETQSRVNDLEDAQENLVTTDNFVTKTQYDDLKKRLDSLEEYSRKSRITRLFDTIQSLMPFMKKRNDNPSTSSE